MLNKIPIRSSVKSNDDILICSQSRNDLKSDRPTSRSHKQKSRRILNNDQDDDLDVASNLNKNRILGSTKKPQFKIKSTKTVFNAHDHHLICSSPLVRMTDWQHSDAIEHWLHVFRSKKLHPPVPLCPLFISHVLLLFVNYPYSNCELMRFTSQNTHETNTLDTFSSCGWSK